MRKSYLDVDSSHVYELMKKSFQFLEGIRSLFEYYNELKSIFIELDYCRSNDMPCATDTEKLKKHTVEDRVYMFFANLDQILDQVSSRILDTSLLLNLEEVILKSIVKYRDKPLWALSITLSHPPLLSKRVDQV